LQHPGVIVRRPRQGIQALVPGLIVKGANPVIAQTYVARQASERRVHVVGTRTGTTPRATREATGFSGTGYGGERHAADSTLVV